MSPMHAGSRRDVVQFAAVGARRGRARQLLSAAMLLPILGLLAAGGDAKAGDAAAAGGNDGQRSGRAEPASRAVEARLLETAARLSAPEMEGRGPGTRGLEAARDLVVEGFRIAGLHPGGENGSYLQPFQPKAADVRVPVDLPAGRAWGEIRLENVVGVLPGSAGPEARCLVLGAHYDHLGRGADGGIRPGADDNASGVAVLLELAARLAEEGPFRHAIVFVAFSGEEAGTLGSQHHVSHPACPLERTMAMVNLDTVGRMEGSRLFLFGAATAAEFPEIFQGINLGFGLDLAMPESAPFASDQVPFVEKGIPAVHLFTGPNEDYHRPGDTAGKLNGAGMRRVCELAQEAAIFLAERTEPLTFIPPGAAKAAPIAPAGPPRRVSLGTIPDFSREGGGILVSGTTPGSPAEAAGVLKGDIIVALDGEAVDNLADFSAALKSHQPGDTVEVELQRGGESRRLRVAVVERK